MQNLKNIIPQTLSILIDDNPVAATSTLTSADTGVFTDGKLVVVGGVTYRIKDTMAQAYDVKNEATADATLANIVKAINASGTPGTEYFAGTLINPLVSAAAVASHATVVTAKTAGAAGNAIATTTDEAKLSWTSTVMAGGGSTIGTMQVKKGGGLMRLFASIAPQLAGTPTYTISILDGDDNVLYTSGNLNENVLTRTALEQMLSEDDVIKITTSSVVAETLPIKVAIR